MAIGLYFSHSTNQSIKYWTF